MGEKRKKDLKGMKNVKTKKPKLAEKEPATHEKKQQILKKMRLQWESLRTKSITKCDRHSQMTKLIRLNSKHIHQFLLTSTVSRILQTVIKHADTHQRLSLFDIIKDRVSDMLTSKYGKHILLKFLKYGGKPEKESIFKFMTGKFLKLIKNSESEPVVEQFYSEEANDQQKNQILTEFYGPSFVMYRNSQKENFVDFISRISDPQKEKALQSLNEIVISLIDRHCLQSSLVHKLIYDVIMSSHVGNNLIGGIRKELVECVSERLPQIMHTPDGSKVAIACIKEGSPEKQESVIAQMKTLVWKAVVDDCAHLVVITLLAYASDEHLAPLLTEMEDSVEAMFEDKYGFRVLSFILTPSDDRLLPASVRAVCTGFRNKWPRDRFARIRERMFAYVDKHVFEMSNMKNMLWFLVLLLTDSENSDVKDHVFNILADKAVSVPEGQDLFVEHPTGHLLLKHLISSGDFAHVLISKLNSKVLAEWTKCNRGCFVIISLFAVKDAVPKLIDMITPLLPTISKLGCSGGKVLTKCIHDAGF